MVTDLKKTFSKPMCSWAHKPISLFCVFGLVSCVFFCPTTTQASVSGSISYTESISSPLPIPPGLGLSVNFSSSISGTVEITGPDGYSATINISGPGSYDVTLGKAGIYNISESFRLYLTGNPSPAITESRTETFNASDEWSYDNSIQGGIGTFDVFEEDVELWDDDHSDNVDVSVSGMSASVTANRNIPPGEGISATIGGNWSVDTSLSVEPPSIETGTIKVNTNLAAATFSLSGPDSYSGSGTSWTKTEAPAGTYTITYNNVPGYDKPSSETKTLTSDGTIVFTGEYTIIEIGTIQVNTNLASAIFSLSGPTNYSGSGTSWTKTQAPVGAYTIVYGNVTGYVKPSSETKALNSGGTITFTGQYTAVETGTIQVNTNLATATFSLTGAASYSGSGTSWTKTQAPVGTYTVIYGEVPGYQTPPLETKTLTVGGTVAFTGQYTIIETGTIQVNTNLASATFSLSGPASYSGSGTSWTKTEALVGEYTITYGRVAGHKTPPQGTKTLILGGTITFTGQYSEIGAIRINTNLESATFSLTGPVSYSGSGTSWIEAEAPPGTYTIAYGDVYGYSKPPPETKTLTRGGFITFTGEYKGIGSIEVNTSLAEATFSLTGPASYSGSGTSWTKTQAPIGTYTIVYNDVSGYETPPSETETLIPGGTVTFTGQYRAIETGTIEVITNLESARFSLTGPANYSGSGTSWTKTQAPVGSYTITYGHVSGYKIPSRETKVLTLGSVVSFTGEYREVETIEVHTNLAEATFNLSGPINYIGSGKSWAKTGALTGEYTIEYGYVSGYETPLQEAKTLISGGKITFTGQYVPSVGTETIEVHTNLPEAIFSLTGPANYIGSGVSWTRTEAAVGEYTIEYKSVPNYETPPPETKVLTSGGKVTFTGEYRGIGKIEVYTNLDGATFSLAGPASYSGDGKSWTKTEATAGEYTVTYDDVPGYSTPRPETGTLAPGDTISFTGIYKDTGTIEVSTNLVDAAFSLSGPVSYTEADFDVRDSGTHRLWTKKEAQVGRYTITYGDLPGYKIPSSEAKTLIKGSTIRLTGEYIRLMGAIEVSTNLRNATFNLSGPASYTQANFSVLDFDTYRLWTKEKAPVGEYTITYNPVEGYEIPQQEILTLTEDDTLSFTGTYGPAIDTTPPAIEFVDVSGSPAREAGDIITIALKGEPGGVAAFSITDIARDVPMSESTDAPGTYKGLYTASEGLNVRGAKLVAHLTDAAGNESVDESKTVSILTAPWDVDGNGAVDFSDLEAVGSNLGGSPTPELDLNSDGAIDILDIVLIGIHFGEKYGQNGGILTAATPLSQYALAPSDFLALGDPRFACPYYLFQNYPNPCNPGTWIPFMLARGGEVAVTIYSPTGKLIRRLELGYRDSGIHVSKDRAAYWNGKNEFGEEVASGVYFYHIRSGDFSVTRKMLVAR